MLQHNYRSQRVHRFDGAALSNPARGHFSTSLNRQNRRGLLVIYPFTGPPAGSDSLVDRLSGWSPWNCRCSSSSRSRSAFVWRHESGRGVGRICGDLTHRSSAPPSHTGSKPARRLGFKQRHAGPVTRKQSQSLLRCLRPLAESYDVALRIRAVRRCD